MANNEDYQLLTKEFDRYSALHAQNLVNQDNVIVQLSVGLLAILATLGKSLLITNRVLGYLIVIFLGITIVQVVAGYFLSNRFFVFVKAKLNSNYQNGVKPISDGLDRGIAGKLNDFINISQSVTFLLGMVFFAVLLIIYMGRK
jgi:hypothetical protein